MQIIDNAWATIKAASPYAPATTTYRNFKAHYGKKLREYYIDSKASNKKHQAYAVDEITAALDQLQSKVELNTQHVHTIANTQDQMLAQPEAYSTHYVPSVVSATTATTPSGLANSAADTRFDKIESTIESLVQQLRMQNQNRNQQQTTSGSTSNTTRRILGDPNEPWRQWKYWCYTCGTNLTHASETATKLGDKNQVTTNTKTATKDNPQGGNSRKDGLWMKWCHPATYEPHDTKGGA
eukprot:CAMPEP_0168177208 /NCGR_PEP_ID=MMETSP0139_2-20121125/8304_1 /TAXON_ID=44445 /ORGANISM="Pseudo-nitzschia australis, Strain 10249 10 AB" /LENGTH=238 /DNA_ID=CAMNT_0008096189 /DNA_START=199 /DNA_END=917 /DNA_ORIENTATION=+